MKIKERVGKLIIILVLLFSFAVFSLLVHYDVFRKVDYQSMLAIQKAANSSIDYLFSVFTLLGST